MSAPQITYYAINLPDCESRRESIAQQAEAAGIAINFLPAVDGRVKKPDTTGHKVKRGSWDWHGHELSGPQLGCLLSHHNALQSFLADSQSPYAVVFEDDAQFGKDLPQHLRELTAITGWDLIKIENRYKKRRGYHITTTSWGSEIIAGTKSDIGTTGLFWTRAGAQKCLKSLETLCLPFDVHLAHYRATSIRMLDILPPLVTQLDDGSTIGDEGKNLPKASHRKRSLRKALGQSAWSLYRSARAALTTLTIKSPSS